MKLRIKEFREDLKWTQKELAEKIDNSQRNVSNWENGSSEPDCESIVKLAEVLDVSIDELFGRNTDTFSDRITVSTVEAELLKNIRILSNGQRHALLQFLRQMIS